MTDTLQPEHYLTERDQCLLECARRGDINSYIELVGVDQFTGDRVFQAECHRRWQELRQKHRWFLLYSPIDHAKTMQAIYTVAFEACRDIQVRGKYELAYGYGCDTGPQAIERTRVINNLISNPQHRAVFPNVEIGHPQGDEHFTLTRTASKDMKASPPRSNPNPTIKAFSTHGNVLGSGFTGGAVLDDTMDDENTYTKMRRDREYGWMKSTFFGRLRSRAGTRYVDIDVESLSGWLWIIGTAQHDEDAVHRLEDEFGVPVQTLADLNGLRPKKFYMAVLREQTTVDNPLWPEERGSQWVAEREIILGPIEAAKQLRNDAKEDKYTTFPMDGCIQVAIDAGVEAGATLDTCHWMDDPRTPRYEEGHSKAGEVIPQDEAYMIGCDFGITKKATSNPTRIYVEAINVFGERRLAYLAGGQLRYNEALNLIVSVWRIFRGEIWPESVAAQEWMCQLLEDAAKEDPTLIDMAGMVNGYRTSYKKADPLIGIPSMATQMTQGKRLIPSPPDQIGEHPRNWKGEYAKVWAFLEECRTWKKHEHAGDYLMAALCANEGGRLWLDKHAGGPKPPSVVVVRSAIYG